MNSEYRAWDVQRKTMVYVSLDIVPTNVGVLMHSHEGLWTLNDMDYETMPYIGVQDADGIKIYAGDIVQVTDYDLIFNDNPEVLGVYEVRYFDSVGYPAFDLYGWDGEANGLSECSEGSDFRMKVIGNIYENKDLLKQ